jgi:hypothetical protein
MASKRNALIHIFREPPQDGDRALCGHVRDELDGYRLIRSDNQCSECASLAADEGMTLVEHSPMDPDNAWRRS